MDNLEIAQKLEQIADLMSLKGEDRFKIIAYQRSARTIEKLTADINDLYLKNKLREIPGVGKGIEKDNKELIFAGQCQRLKKLKKNPSQTLRINENQWPGTEKGSISLQKIQGRYHSGVRKIIKNASALETVRLGRKERTKYF